MKLLRKIRWSIKWGGPVACLALFCLGIRSLFTQDQFGFQTDSYAYFLFVAVGMFVVVISSIPAAGAPTLPPLWSVATIPWMPHYSSTNSTGMPMKMLIVPFWIPIL